ncbi:MerR family transcriptional regulator [Paracoccus rhizosphaerae]|uniref:MerR family transcriptional regulator n=1 Tax=Paracoccus rhizosphaerae TaxID=1133347 RepID=A0ABV6CFT8_9RHOB|nr:MerR family transcriptional regulator [Paracoccus rhizosphaerae]
MNITEAARVSGLAAKTIRYYEDIGLVSPRRGANGYRQFRPDDIRRLIFLGRARRLDFSLQDCRDLLALNKDADRSSANVRKIASRHLAHVDTRLTELLQLRDALQNLVDSCAGDGQPDCTILDALTVDYLGQDGS